MALPVQLNYYSNTDTSIENLQNSADGLYIGHHRVSLTNYDTTGLPAIAVGSKVENNGAFLDFTTECAISGSPSDGTVYIYLVPSGDPALGTATVTPTFTNTAPTWSDSKQGWYGTGGNANYRYLEFKMKKASTVYSDKRRLDYDDARWFMEVYKTAVITATANTEVTLVFDTEVIDTLGVNNTSNGNITIPKTGYYDFNITAQITGTATTALRRYNFTLRLYKTSSAIRTVSSVSFKPATTASQQIFSSISDSTIEYLTAGEVLYYTVEWGVIDTNSATAAENGGVSGSATTRATQLNVKYIGLL